MFFFLFLKTILMFLNLHKFVRCSLSYYYFLSSINVASSTFATPLQKNIYHTVKKTCRNQCFYPLQYQWIYQPYVQNVLQPYSFSVYQSNSSSHQVPLVSPYIYQTNRPFSETTLPSKLYKISSYSSKPMPLKVYSKTKQLSKLIKKKKKLTSVVSANQNLPSKKINPCLNGDPLVNQYNVFISCNYIVKPNGGCPENYWCHTGISYELTTCCPNFNFKERCNLPRLNGEGHDLIPRWYYDSMLRKCKRFLYKGLKGNSNNFITKIECLEYCETTNQATEYKNPCSIGPPAQNLDGELLLCGPYNLDENLNKCPIGYYCNVGENIETTACCELSSVQNPCLLKKNEGEGSGNLKRYYFDILINDCKTFYYKGMRGNENNFLTLEDCKLTCNDYINPCPILYDERKECSKNNVSLCNLNEWCHIGSGSNTSVCCPGAVEDPCQLPLDLGQGIENLIRWFADPTDTLCERKCRSFVYRGMKGNQNNFLSKELCEAQCKPKCLNPCSDAEVLIDNKTKQPKSCSATNTCPSDYWCHYGATPETTVCCSKVKNPCDLILIKGDGSASLTRWYYNSENQTCEKFLYHGIGGNQNNFLNREECVNSCLTFENPCSGSYPLMIANHPKICTAERRCPNTHFCHVGLDDTSNYCCPKNGDPCEHSLSLGQGPNFIPRYYFNKNTKRCSEFMYKGLKGNANNFLTIDDCENVCQVFTHKNPCASGLPLINERTNEFVICGGIEQCPKDYFCHVGGSPDTTNCCPLNENKNRCYLPLILGEGNERLERWYFDANTELSCLPFFYTGLKGNANNFLSKEECKDFCETSNPCLLEGPLKTNDGDLLLCDPENPFNSCLNSSYFCHVNGNDLAQNVCCLRSAIDPCQLPVNFGIGLTLIKRWYFNSALNECEMFFYKGAHGNENNFITQEVCKRICPSENNHIPSINVSYENYCPHGFPLIDKKNNLPIICGLLKKCPENYVCHIDADNNSSVCCQDPKIFCMEKRDSGYCENEEIRYGYNPLADSCVPYKYNGCGGTLNNFKTFKKCSEICCHEYKD